MFGGMIKRLLGGSQETAEKNKAQGEAFLTKNATAPGVVVCSSGLQYRILEEGNGACPGSTDSVTVHYAGKLLNGKVFDSSYKRGEPLSFPVNGVIAGWTEALKMMPVGSKWELFIPAPLGYGVKGAGGLIGPNATLVFEVELLAIQ
ncbi:MAG: FKBP-type peptidyl-prolyl cis-trans isomerase [SAR324 cluster bacterium]|nr:FKBP-type peptidyl-prolyl cis-trans isomerase [SAR324 cluster bacterium]